MGTTATVVLDGVDITSIAIEGNVSRALNRIGQAAVRCEMETITDIFGTSLPGAGSYLKVYLDNPALGGPTLWHHGRVLLCEVTAAEDVGYAVFNSSDPLELWRMRPVRDDDGDFSLPSIIETYQFGPQIVQAMVLNSEGAGLGPPADAEGPTRLFVNTPASGSVSLVGAPTDWPMTMAELASLLVSTGVLDIVVTPIEFDVNQNYGQLDLYNGDYGTNRTGSVILQYGMGLRNVRALRWNEDMSNMCNKLWYYLGPRVLTQNDPAGDQHWQANITGDDPGLTYPPGGGLSPPHTSVNNQIGVQDYTSRLAYDVRMDIKIFDGKGDEAIVAHNLYRRLWQEEQWIRAQPQTIVHVTPTRDTLIGEFDIGDLITVEAAVDVKGGFSGAQRVYGYTIAWDAHDSTPALGEIQVSSDAEGL